MKMYDKIYEDVFCNKHLLEVRCKLEKITLYNDNPKDLNSYISLFKKQINKYDIDLWNNSVKIIWLIRRFTYGGRRRVPFKQYGYGDDLAFSIFCRNYLGMQAKAYKSSSDINRAVINSFDYYYPEFDEEDPFEKEYEYPLKNLPLMALCTVAGFKGTLGYEILDYCDKMEMSYVQFLDYVINYIHCHNEEMDNEGLEDGEKVTRYTFFSGEGSVHLPSTVPTWKKGPTIKKKDSSEYMKKQRRQWMRGLKKEMRLYLKKKEAGEL